MYATQKLSTTKAQTTLCIGFSFEGSGSIENVGLEKRTCPDHIHCTTVHTTTN